MIPKVPLSVVAVPALIGMVIGLGLFGKRGAVPGAILGGALGFATAGTMSGLRGGGRMGQIDWHVEDPTGGSYDESMGPLGPGESIAVASQWAGMLHPRGFAY